MHLPLGTLLQGGKYKIERYISSGGFGCTYEARHVMLNNTVAIKEFFVKDCCNRDASTNRIYVATQSKVEIIERLRKKFVEEARAIFGMSHPNIVRVTDIFEENGTVYYVMDYINGSSLASVIEKHGALGEAQTLGYIEQVASALSYVHSHNRLHLDVKPQNIMIDQSGKAVLIDFGVSKQYDEVNGENTSTLLGCTPGYAPIEQSGNGVSEFYPSTDIYALGATLYKTLTGVTPVAANLRASGEELPLLPADISLPTRTAIEAAMQINKARRPQSVAEFLELLENKEERAKRKDESEEQNEDLIDDVDVEVTVLPERAKIKDERGKIKEQSEAIKEQHNANKEQSEETRAVEKKTEQPTIKNNEPVAPKKNRTALVAAVVLLGLLMGGVLLFAVIGSDSNDDISTDQKVDLGLSVCWAGWNVGASSPEGYGNHYAWGETSTKTNYTESSYQYYNGSYVNIGSNISGTQYDVARAQWGGSWRMPTKAEFQELIDRCTWTWTTYNGVNGYKVTGPNGNSIFLPAAGGRYGTELSYRGSYGSYWSGSLNESSQNDAYRLYFNSGDRNVYFNYREGGCSVRPVSE